MLVSFYPKSAFMSAFWMSLALSSVLAGGCSSRKAAMETSLDQEAAFEEAMDNFESFISTDGGNPLALDWSGVASSPYVEGEYRASATREHDLLHTSLRVAFDWPNAHLLGEAELTLRPYFYSTEQVMLDAKGFDLHEIALVEGPDARSTLKYSYDQQQISVQLPRAYTRQDTFKLYIRYTAKPNDLPEGGSDAITSDKGLYFINHDRSIAGKPTQVWTQGETEASSCWFPTIDKPNERTTQEIYITVHDTLTTLSNGMLRSQVRNADGTRTDHWVMDQPHAPYLFMMAVGRFAVVKDTWQGIPTDYYVDPAYEPYARAIFGNTPEMLTFYSELFGVRYPWSKYSQVVVEDFVSGAMENTTATIHFDGLHSTDRQLLDETHEDIIAHEAVHQWFGDLVTCESWSNLPLNESFATYGEYLWIEYKYGRQAADYHLNNDLDSYLAESEAKQVDLVRFTYNSREDMFDGHSYSKGGRVLHMLRKTVGDEAFFAGLKKYLEDNAFSDVEMHEFRLAMEDVTGQDLNWFFNQWFFASGHPELEIDYLTAEENGGELAIRIRQTQTRSETPVYRIPLDIDLYTGGVAERRRVVLDQREQVFPMGVSQVDWVNVDAEKMLLAEVSDNKPAAWYALQLREGPLFMDALEAVYFFADQAEEGDNAANSMLEEAFDHSFWGVQEAALDAYILGDGITPEVKARIRDLALRHRKSDVRAEALRNLGGLEDPAYLPDFEAALQDSSWRVVGTALRELARLDPQRGLQLAETMENEESLSVRFSVLGIYGEHGGPEKGNTFNRMLQDVTGWEQYVVIQQYGKFLQRQDNFSLVKAGCEAIAEAAMRSDVSWMNQVAGGAISGILSGYASAEQAEQASELEVILDQLMNN
jgi:aminopeptidase N